MASNFKLLIKKGNGAPASGALDVAELGFDTTNNNLYIGKGPENAAIPISPTLWLRVAGDSALGALKYNGLTKLDGALYGGTTAPTATTRLNYDGNFYATKLYSAGNEVITANNLPEYPTVNDSTITITATGGIKTSGSFSLNQATDKEITLEHTNSTLAGNVGPTSSSSPDYGEDFSVPYIVYDGHGHITSAENKIITLPPSDDTNTTYTIKASLINGGAQFDLDSGGDGSEVTDSIKFLGSGGTTVSQTNADTITISSHSPLTEISSTEIEDNTHSNIRAITGRRFQHGLGNIETGNTTLNLGTSSTSDGNLKTINLGTGGVTGSTTNINIGSSIEGTTIISSPNVSIPGNLTVDGNLTVNNVEMIHTSNGIIFEGATADEFETTLRAIDPTADRTIELPDAGGTVALLDNIGNGKLTVTAGNHLTLSSGNGEFYANQSGNESWTIDHDNSAVTEGTYGETSNQMPTYGEAFKIPNFTVDEYGHLTDANEYTVTIPPSDNTTYSISTVSGSGSYEEIIRLTAGGNGSGSDDITLAVGAVGTLYGLTIEESESGDKITFKHAVTSEQDSLSSTARTYVTGVELDTYGHVTGLTTGTETVEDTDTTYSLSTVSGSESYEEIIRLTAGGDGSGSDDIKLAVGTVDNLHGLTISETGDTITFKHADTSSANSSDNSGRTYIQNITLDTYGHITGLSTATETVVDTDTDNFIDLIDTPSAYPSNTDDYTYFVKVKSETEGQGLELEFTKELNCGEYTVAT
jgi:hypothetical protein